MRKIRVEAFLSIPLNPSTAELERLLTELTQEYQDKIEIIVYQDRNKLYEKYNLSALPALIIGDLIRFIGFCPDKESIIAALDESSLD